MSHKSKRKRKMSKHHLKPKSRGGQKIKSNLILIDIERHCAWHKLWGNRTLNEVILLLQRLQQLKKAQRLNVKL